VVQTLNPEVHLVQGAAATSTAAGGSIKTTVRLLGEGLPPVGRHLYMMETLDTKVCVGWYDCLK
jgi:hypothetical protein